MPVVAVVSGVNSGNDFHIVLRLARELPQDGIVYLCSRDECRRQQAANEIPLELGSKVKVLQMDVTDPKSIPMESTFSSTTPAPIQKLTTQSGWITRQRDVGRKLLRHKVRDASEVPVAVPG
mmetsp:Transcript_46533/g.101085  ORF Transcript_46533/g.101085 Transcript_46533/m.101085 type:complete len:122 (+) Transcript_46533:44-409(+)